MGDAINLIDRDYTTVKSDDRVSKNIIKTRKLSFKRIAERWAEFRLSLMNKELERAKENLVKDNYHVGTSGLSLGSEAKMNRRTAAVARLEEKIMILKREDVPTDYRKNRAIKLRNNMMANLTYNSANAYSVEEDKIDKVFEEEQASVVPETNEGENMAAVATSEDIDVEKVSAANEEKIADDVEKAMHEDVSREDISSVIDSKFADLEENANVGSFVSRDEVESAVQNAIDAVEEDSDTHEVAAEEVHENVSEQPVEDSERVHVSQNESTEAKVNHFDSEGEVKPREGYVPMTDDQIAEARRNIEYEKYEEIYKTLWEEKKKRFKDALQEIKNSAKRNIVPEVPMEEAVRDEVVVTPEREEKVEEYTTAKEEEKPKEDLHMDYTDATKRDVARAIGKETSVSGLAALKERALKLREEQENARKDQEAARREQVEEAERAMEIRRQTEAKKEAYAEKFRALEEYCAALEEDTKSIRSSAAISRNDTACNRRFIESRVAEMTDYDERIQEIDSIIDSPENGRSR